MDCIHYFHRTKTGNYFGRIDGKPCTVFKARSGDWSFFLNDKPGDVWFASYRDAMATAVKRALLPTAPVLPACIRFFGLRPPITRDALLAKYRELARQTHPDHGGSCSAFKVVQSNFEAASQLLEVA